MFQHPIGTKEDRVKSSMKFQGKTFVALVLAIGALPSASEAHFTGPPDGRAGDPPANRTCKDIGCHNSFVLNSGNGALALEGLPASYVPGGVYDLQVVLSDPGQFRWGFEATVIRPSTGNQAGVLAPVDTALVQVSEGAGDLRDYIMHKEAGTFPGQGSGNSWNITWTAPAAGSGTSHFYFAGNAANNNDLPTGDYIYSSNIAVPEAGAADVTWPILADGLRFRAFPNPTASGATFEFQLPSSHPSELRILDLAGRHVRRLQAPAVAQSMFWDGRDEDGHLVPGGVYYTILASGPVQESRRLVIVR